MGRQGWVQEALTWDGLKNGGGIELDGFYLSLACFGGAKVRDHGFFESSDHAPRSRPSSYAADGENEPALLIPSRDHSDVAGTSLCLDELLRLASQITSIRSLVPLKSREPFESKPTANNHPVIDKTATISPVFTPDTFSPSTRAMSAGPLTRNPASRDARSLYPNSAEPPFVWKSKFQI